MKNADLRALALMREIYADRKEGVEIGVYRGDLSMRLLGANPGIFLHMVDPWRESVDGDTYLTTDDHIARMTQAGHDENYRAALESVKPFTGRYKIHRMTSKEAAKEFADGSLDFVFIDGDHSYEGVCLDIELWHPKLKKGGLLSGHDYRDDKDYGVIRAVTEFCTPRLGLNYTWFHTK